MSDVQPLPPGEDPPSSMRGGDGLAARVASRICHDLVSPLGAIANGIELLLLSGIERSPEMALISESVESANARIRFFRLVFGAPGPQPVAKSEIITTLKGLEQGSRLRYDWTVEGDHPRDQVRVVFLLLQCLESAMPVGGRIQVNRDGEFWLLSARSPRLRIQPEVWDALGPGREAPPMSPALVQFALLPPALDRLGRQLNISFGTEAILVRF